MLSKLKASSDVVLVLQKVFITCVMTNKALHTL